MRASLRLISGCCLSFWLIYQGFFVLHLQHGHKNEHSVSAERPCSWCNQAKLYLGVSLSPAPIVWLISARLLLRSQLIITTIKPWYRDGQRAPPY